MADNVGYTPGAGALIAADEVAGALVQRVKAVYGADGSATDMDEKPSTQANQASALTKLDTIVAALASLLAELQLKTEPIDTQPIIAAALPLPTGAATEATLSALNNKSPALGQATKANSVPVTLASDQGQVGATITPADLVESTYSVSGVIPINTILVSIDCTNKKSISIQCSSMGTTGVATPEWSNDNSNWLGDTIFTPAGASATTFNAAGGWQTNVKGKYFRLRLSTATTAGTTTLNVQACTVRQQTFYATQAANIAQVNGVTPDMNAGAASANTLRVVTANNSSVNVAQMNGVAVTMGNGVAGTGVQRVAIASDNTANSNPWLDTLVPSAAQGASTHHHAISAGTTNATSVKASAGCINDIHVCNTNAAARFLKIYNKASAPTVGTDTPIKTFMIPANWAGSIGCGPYGIRCSTGIAYALTTGIAVADTGAVGASEHAVNIGYT
jgi:hypothetical protein